MDTYTKEFAKIVTGEVIWWHQRCIVRKKLCRKKVSRALNRCIAVLENYYFYLAIRMMPLRVDGKTRRPAENFEDLRAEAFADKTSDMFLVAMQSDDTDTVRQDAPDKKPTVNRPSYADVVKRNC
jgi:hypothetical protein